MNLKLNQVSQISHDQNEYIEVLKKENQDFQSELNRIQSYMMTYKSNITVLLLREDGQYKLKLLISLGEVNETSIALCSFQ